MIRLKPFLLAGITVLILISCATSPLGRRQVAFMPPSQLDAMGAKAFQSHKQKIPIEKSGTTNRYVSCISSAILEASKQQVNKWEVVVFSHKSANAFALPGGKIGVHTGLLEIAENQHQLATVIGHEIAHVLGNHSNERVSQEFALKQGLTIVQGMGSGVANQKLMGLLGMGAQLGVILPFSRIHENEADEMGLYLMAQAGFDPRESIRLWQNMSRGQKNAQPPEFLSTHPAHNTRVTRLNNAMKRAKQYHEQAKASGKNPKCG